MYLNKEQLRDIFRDLGLADATLQEHYQDYGLDEYAEDLLIAWINKRDDVLDNPDYPGGATWENLRKALAKNGHNGAREQLRHSRDPYQGFYWHKLLSALGIKHHLHVIIMITLPFCLYFSHLKDG